MIPYGRQQIGDEDVAAVLEALRADFITQGPRVGAFEKALAAEVGAPGGAVAVNSATSALHLACLALGLGPGKLLWTSPISFVASANAALYCGAAVDFVDIDRATFNLSVPALREKLAAARRSGKLPDVVMPVHLGGEPADLAGIAELSAEYGFRVIEDASHAVGASYRGEPVGNCRYSDVTVFSFHPVKIITTAEGGVAIARDAAVNDRLALLRSHGITRDPAALTGPSEGAWYYEQVALGFNYRLTDLQAALGIAQLRRLRDFVTRRQALAARYDRLVGELPVRTQHRDRGNRSALHLYLVHIDEAATGKNRRDVFDAMRHRGVGVNVHYIPIHLQPWYRNLGFRLGMFPESEAYYRGAITLPLYPALTEAEQDGIVAALAAALK